MLPKTSKPSGVVLFGLFASALILTFAFLQSAPAEEPASRPTSTEQAKETNPAPVKPLWTFVWISDMHMHDANLKFLTKAMHYIDEELKPNFVLISGDNNYKPAPPADPANPESKELRRQRFCKQFLDKHLKTSYVIIPGDDWPAEFDKVFGPRQFSFDYGGIHFLLLAPDRAYVASRREGLTVFDPPTKTWIRQDLEKNKTKPTIVVIHEPIFPPTFLDAPPLRKLLAGYPSVFAVLQGHLHMDLQHQADGKAYLVAPSLGAKPDVGMKQVNVLPTGLDVHTIRCDIKNQTFERETAVLNIKISPGLQKGLTRPKDSKFVKVNYNSLPAKPQVQDPELDKRFGELMRNSMIYMMRGNK